MSERGLMNEKELTSPRHTAGAKKGKKKRIGKPNALVWFFFWLILTPYYRIRYGLSFDRKALKGERGPSIILAPHTCANDPFLIGLAMYPLRPTYVVSAHFMAKPRLGRFFRFIRVIPKRMFSADVGAIMNMKRAAAEGNNIVIFPEGRLPCWGRSVPLSPGTAELCRRLKANVYVAVCNGAYLTFPKWAEAPRRGKIRVEFKKLFTGEEAAAATAEEVERALVAHLTHDDELAMPGVRYRSKDMTAGLDGILFRCPCCLKEWTLTSSAGHLRCSCGLDATLDQFYKLHGAPFQTVNEWFAWQQASIDIDTPLTGEMRVGVYGEDGQMDEHAGFGVATLSSEEFSFRGTVFGEETAFSVRTERLGGLPISVGKNFDIHSENRLFYMIPEPNPRAVVKWVSYLDAVKARALSE